jgi:GT2 family glycosyltransferase/glycosyltransferase involved in cell wall biosynthesis
MTDRAERDAAFAWQRGQSALAAGDADVALRWLDRAARIAPDDLTIALALAAACLERDNARAAALFRDVTRRQDVRQAWLGLAVAALRLADPAAAAEALGRALSRHVSAPDANLAADAIAGAVGAPGWCSVSGDGRLLVALRRPVGLLAAALDDNPLRLAGESSRGTRRLPAEWLVADQLHVVADGCDLLGSPIDLAAIRRTEGCVECHAGGLFGWAWHPAEPEADPILRIRSVRHPHRSIEVRATDRGVALAAPAVLARPRGFQLATSALADLPPGPLRVVGRDGRDLLGSPLDPGAEPRAAAAAARAVARLFPSGASARRGSPIGPVPADVAGAPPVATVPGRREVEIIIPVHGGLALVMECLDSVLATIGPRTRVTVVDDASREPDLAAALDRLAGTRRVRLVRNHENQGFPRSANAGLRAAAGRDAVLLNSDTLTPPLWLERLQTAAYSAPDIGTACPLSNDATILSYPDPDRPSLAPDRAGTARLAAQAYRANRDTVVDIPTAVGFCMFIRHDCLDAVGLLREDSFAQGYGEENDFSLRARHLGWRHVAVPGAFVAHRGAGSFGAARAHLAARNGRVLNRLHPGYDALIAEFRAADPLASPRRRLDTVRWRTPGRGGRSVLLVSHDEGGGVERHLASRCAALRAEGFRPIVLRPAPAAPNPGGIVLGDGSAGGFPNLRFSLPAELPTLTRFLARERPAYIEFHHLLGHHPGVLALPDRLGVPYRVHVHDYAWFCPRLVLVGGNRRYCGEPDVADCESCVIDHGRYMADDMSVAALRDRSAIFLGAAERVEVPSQDAAARLMRYFPALVPAVVPLGPDPQAMPRRGSPPSRAVRVCVVGAIGVEKGYDVLLGAARDAARRRLPLEFVVVGHTIDDERLLATDLVFITGPYRPEEIEALIRAQQADFALLPSVTPETWCFTLTEAWRAGLDVAAFDFGAQAERIRRTGRGWLLPPGINSAALNDRLLAIAQQTGHQCTRQTATFDCALPSS